MGSLPTMLGFASWVSAQGTVDGIIDAMFTQQRLPPVLNLYHPRPTTWSKMMELVCTEIKAHQPHRELSIIPFSQWLQELVCLMQGTEKRKIRSSAAIKMLAFFRRINHDLASETEEAGGYPYLNCDKMKEISPSFANMKQLGKKDAEAWVSHWVTQGMFRSALRTTAAL